MRGFAKFLSWFLPVALLSCSTLFNADEGKVEPVKPKPRPTVNHAVHAERELECADCHDPEETGEPSMPKAETCFECHEDLAKENERVQAYFEASKETDGSYRFDRPALWPDLIANHKGHAKYEVSCEECHSKPSEKAFPRPDPSKWMADCMSCHEEKQAKNDCAACHEKTRKDVKPPDHNPASFMRLHGRKAPADWQQGEGASCAICHAVPESCNGCHQKSKPAGHKHANFQWNHGRGEYSTLDTPFDESNCALCHTENSCVRCHQLEPPRNHNETFKRRLHGQWADIERQSCQTCHKQDWCQRCHEVDKPVGHVGTWGNGQQTHCVACHEPLQSNGCYVCHKNTLGHLQATPLPADPRHSTALDPAACETCHQVLPHLNDGGRCRRCHR